MELLIIIVIGYTIFLHTKISRVERLFKHPRTAVEDVSAYSQIENGSVGSSNVTIMRSYVDEQRQKGASDSEIESRLSGVGWSALDIQNTMRPATTPLGVAEDSGGESSFSNLITWFVTDWLMKLGVFLVLLAIGWFVTYAFAHNWIGPVGRITLGILFGIAVIGVAEWRIKDFRSQGSVLFVLGSMTILMTILAAQFAFDTPMFTSVAAMGMMFLVIVYLGLVSVRYNSKSLAVLSLIGGYSVPAMVGLHNLDPVVMYTYLLLVTSGTLWVVFMKGWRVLTPLSLGCLFLFSADLSSASPDVEYILLAFATVFGFMYISTGLYAMVHNKNIQWSDTITAIGVGFFELAWVMQVVPEYMQSLAMGAWALIFTLAAFFVFSKTSQRAPFFIYGGIAAGLIGAATALELEGSVLIIVFLLEILVLMLVVHTLLPQRRLLVQSSLLYIIPILMSLGSITTYRWRDSIPFDDMWVLLLSMLVYLGLALYFKLTEASSFSEDDRLVEQGVAYMYAILGVFYGMALMYLIPYSLFTEQVGDYGRYATADAAMMITLVLYTILGLALYIRGKLIGIQGYKVLGGVLLGFVVFRMLFIEVWKFELSARIIIFFIVGIMLIATAFIGKSKEEKNITTNETVNHD